MFHVALFTVCYLQLIAPVPWLYRTFSRKWLHFICKKLKNKVAKKRFYHTYSITTHIQISGSIKAMNTTIPIFLRQAA